MEDARRWVEGIRGVFPVRHAEVEKTGSTTFLSLPLLPPPPFFFLSALELNAKSPGDSFLSVKDENEARKKEGEGESRAENKTG